MIKLAFNTDKRDPLYTVYETVADCHIVRADQGQKPQLPKVLNAVGDSGAGKSMLLDAYRNKLIVGGLELLVSDPNHFIDEDYRGWEKWTGQLDSDGRDFALTFLNYSGLGARHPNREQIKTDLELLSKESHVLSELQYLRDVFGDVVIITKDISDLSVNVSARIGLYYTDDCPVGAWYRENTLEILNPEDFEPDLIERIQSIVPEAIIT